MYQNVKCLFNFFWWGGTELNRHRNIRLIYSQLSSPLAQPPHEFVSPVFVMRARQVMSGVSESLGLGHSHAQCQVINRLSLCKYIISNPFGNVKCLLNFFLNQEFIYPSYQFLIL